MSEIISHFFFSINVQNPEALEQRYKIPKH